MTWAPVLDNQLFRSKSEFWDDVLASKYVKRTKPDYSKRQRLTPEPRKGISSVVFSFSDLTYFFECPYQFKLRILYGFNPPIREELGFGRSLHNALADIHARAIKGDHAVESEVSGLVENHLHLPFAHPELRKQMEQKAEEVLRHYIQDNRKDFDKIEMCEKQINIALRDGVSVTGRIDLVRRLDTQETSIVDAKSNDRAQPEEVTEHQLHIYALGYEELTGKRADYVEIYNLDERKGKKRSVDGAFIDEVKVKVYAAAEALHVENLPAKPSATKCGKCDYKGMCTPGAGALQAGTR